MSDSSLPFWEDNPDVDAVFGAYPPAVFPFMARLRQLVRDVARETPEIGLVQEALKWGEPSFIAKYGSTLRMDWKPRRPDQYALYFKCTSKLVITFREVYGPIFNYEGTRAILFEIGQEIPEDEVKHCIRTTLMYHKLKGRSLLGMAIRT